MSTATDLAKAEAARAEAENPDTEPDEPLVEPDDPDTEPDTPDTPAPETLTPEDVEKRYKAAGKVAERYAAALTKALGPELMASLVASPIDALPGFIQVDANGLPDPELVGPMLAFLRQEPPVQYRQNPATKTCTLCGGPGDLLTGASRKGNELTQCTQCGGLGYTTPENTRVGLPAATPAPLAVVPAPTANGAPETHGLEDPEVARLRAAGYTVLEPIHLQ